MKIVIDIDEKDYKRIKEIPEVFNSLTSRAYKAIRNGTPLPEHHGRLIDADAFIERTEKIYKRTGYVLGVYDIEEEPTIIEGSESNDS